MFSHLPEIHLTDAQMDFISNALTVIYYKSIITSCLVLAFFALFYWSADNYLVNKSDRAGSSNNIFLIRLAFSSLTVIMVTLMMSDILMWIFFPDTFIYSYLADFSPYPGG